MPSLRQEKIEDLFDFRRKEKNNEFCVVVTTSQNNNNDLKVILINKLI